MKIGLLNSYKEDFNLPNNLEEASVNFDPRTAFKKANNLPLKDVKSDPDEDTKEVF